MSLSIALLQRIKISKGTLEFIYTINGDHISYKCCIIVNCRGIKENKFVATASWQRSVFKPGKRDQYYFCMSW